MKKLLRKMYFRTLDFIKNLFVDKKKAAIALGALIVLAIAGYYGWQYFKPKEYKIYEALIAVRNQFNSDPAEDAKNSLKIGDVLLTLPEGHRWSDLEKASYLILKMRLTAEQAQTLVLPEERKAVIPKPKTAEEKKQAAERKKAEGDRQQMETVRARRYRIKIEELNINADAIISAQPYPDKIFDWKIVEKKAKI
jgi:hypothetical protein